MTAAQLLDGRKHAEKIVERLAQEHRQLVKNGNPLSLAVLVANDHPASEIYLEAQKKKAAAIGIEHRIIRVDPKSTSQQIESEIRFLNEDPQTTGIMVQLPLPKNLDPRRIASKIHPFKDVEGMHPENLGRHAGAKASLVSPTATAVIELIRVSGKELEGCEAVVVGASELVGKPVGLFLINRLATLTYCHEATDKAGRLQDHVQRAEVLVVCVGKPGLIPGAWIRQGAVVVDVGTNRVDGKIVGDIDFETAVERASWITPVPGGVGPLTTVSLMQNVFRAYRLQSEAEGDMI
ncbi:MAG: bifunctional 5,10-methylenetetrahydrofolate dehydrogenase/5,10-methenyltetrahydrofolate cyclohydrolase [Candidatus Omnitrophica bacterium]|nr:bifunctional 5,10-methylenetetrahydrofolate dehydrogenase/5,10-methenyltetrahydrofolate cyclohydrolase [Candidatus Omnitrophota bacterium]